MKCGLCSSPHTPCDLRAWIEKGGVLALACSNCIYFRDNDTATKFKEHAQKINREQKKERKGKKGPRGMNCPEIDVANTTFDQRRRDKKHRPHKKCKGITTVEMRKFMAQNGLCHYCGSCATNIDRKNIDDCYSLTNGGVPACASCNRRRRDKPRKLFISHMQQVATAPWTPSGR